MAGIEDAIRKAALDRAAQALELLRNAELELDADFGIQVTNDFYFASTLALQAVERKGNRAAVVPGKC